MVLVTIQVYTDFSAVDGGETSGENVGVQVLKERLAILERTAPEEVKQEVLAGCRHLIDDFTSFEAGNRGELRLFRGPGDCSERTLGGVDRVRR